MEQRFLKVTTQDSLTMLLSTSQIKLIQDAGNGESVIYLSDKRTEVVVVKENIEKITRELSKWSMVIG